jgi:signal transduction histidine kinase
MRKKLYGRFIKPVSSDIDQAGREIVLNYLLLGTFVLALIALTDTIFAPIISKEPFFIYRVLEVTGTLLFVAILYFVAHYKQKYKISAIILTLLITFLACSMVYRWGLLLPAGILLCGLAIVMAGILVSARSALYTAAGITLIFVFLQYAKVQHYIHPDLTWMRSTSTAGDVIGYAALFLIIALVSWLFNRQMEASLRRARRSEKALQHQKDLLEVKVEKRARQLEAAQLDKMQQLYRFAELGQLSTALFHDLANHLSTVNVDIEGLAAGGESDIMKRIQQNVGHINSIVKRVRQQIGGKNSVEMFDVMREINEVVRILEPTAKQARSIIEIVADESVRPHLSYKGDITRFRQVILNLISNGMEAYSRPSRRSKKVDRVVTLSVKRQRSTLLISVTDYGMGVPVANQSKIFEPFYTTKEKGVGIGLFIVRQVVENDFDGELTMTSSKQQGTTFTVSLPRSYYAKSNPDR